MAKSKRKAREDAKLKKQEKQFFIYAIAITLVVVAILYIFFVN